jgi:A/G-specific adenine glycosylase
VSLSPAAKRKLLSWFRRNARDLPWRRDRDPYRIWVSEVMLQQTTVAAVAPRFDQFLGRFPDVRSLAAADEQDVLKVWEGMGYYGRARNLHRAAKKLVAEHGGELPDDPAVWAELPGVGRYILGAVLSQAFDRRLPIVEANTKRVLCRLFAQAGDVTSAPVQAWLWQAAEAVLPRKHVGDFNQALMELGALVCRARSVACECCPLARRCPSAGRVEVTPRGIARVRFEDTNRWVRGRVVAALVAGEALPADIEEARLDAAVEGLVRDGVVRRVGQGLALG